MEYKTGEIKKYLNTKILGRNIKIFETINSTSTYLKENESEDGDVVIALHQSAGRGRKGREFISEKKQGIYFSFLLDSNIEIDKLSKVTICVAVAVTRAIKEVCGIDTDIKWVNDIFYNNKKLGGILTEATLINIEKKAEKLIIGVGLNTGKIPKEISNIGISFDEIMDYKNYENRLISEILNYFEKIYFDYFEEKFSEIIYEYKQRLFIMNKLVDVVGSSSYLAKVIDLNEKGELVILDENNNKLTLNSGEISVRVGSL